MVAKVADWSVAPGYVGSSPIRPAGVKKKEEKQAEVVRLDEDIVLKTTGPQGFKGSSPLASAGFSFKKYARFA